MSTPTEAEVEALRFAAMKCLDGNHSHDEIEVAFTAYITAIDARLALKRSTTTTKETDQ
jgi:hypothetical protein